MAHCKDKSDEKQSYCGEWSFFLSQNGCRHVLVVDICNLSPHHFLSASQPTVCVRRATGGAWMVAVWGIVPGATGRTTVETILMKPSVTVSWVLWLEKFFLPAVMTFSNDALIKPPPLAFVFVSHTLLSRSIPVQRRRLHLQLQQVWPEGGLWWCHWWDELQ